MSEMKPKDKAARKSRGFLSARQLADIREIAIISRDTGIPLTLHGVTAGNQEKCSSTLSAHAGNQPTSTVQAGRGPQPKASIGSASEKPEQQQERNAKRRQEFLDAKRAGALWLPMVQSLLYRSREKFRDDMWTEWMRTRLALFERLRCFVRRALSRHAALQLRALLTSTAPTTSSNSLDDKAANDAEDKATLVAALAAQAAKAAALAAPPADTPPNDSSDAHCTGRPPSPPRTPPGRRSQAPPVKQASTQNGKKSRKGKSSKPLQPANRG